MKKILHAELSSETLKGQKEQKKKNKAKYRLPSNYLIDDECTVDHDGDEDGECEEEEEGVEEKKMNTKKRKLHISKNTIKSKAKNMENFSNIENNECETIDYNMEGKINQFENKKQEEVFSYRYNSPPISKSISFRGVPFIFDENKLASLPSPSFATENVKYLRLTLDDNVEDISPKTIVKKLLNICSLIGKKKKKQKKIVDKINIKGENYSIEYSKGKGDEFFLDQGNTKNINYIGHNFIGRMHIHKIDNNNYENENSEEKIDNSSKSHTDEKILSEYCYTDNDSEYHKTIVAKNKSSASEQSWQSEQSFVSWHKNAIV